MQLEALKQQQRLLNQISVSTFSEQRSELTLYDPTKDKPDEPAINL